MTIRNGANHTVLVTGASGGIGADLAGCFAANGHDLILCARSEPALRDVAIRLAAAHGITATPIVIDLQLPGAGAALAREISARGLTVDILVNNAGYGIGGAFAGSDAAEQIGMVDLNCRALVELTHAFWPDMLARGHGGILNVASTAAFQPGPLMAIYYASKAFVLSFSEALWEEARGTGVTVSCLCPGPTATGFRARAGTHATRMARGGGMMDSATVARQGYRGFLNGDRVVVPGWRNATMVRIGTMLPHRVVLGVVRRMLEPAVPR